MESSKRIVPVVGALTFLASFGVYLRTMQKSVPFWDSGEFIAVSHILGKDAHRAPFRIAEAEAIAAARRGDAAGRGHVGGARARHRRMERIDGAAVGREEIEAQELRLRLRRDGEHMMERARRAEIGRAILLQDRRQAPDLRIEFRARARIRRSQGHAAHRDHFCCRHRRPPEPFRFEGRLEAPRRHAN